MRTLTFILMLLCGVSAAHAHGPAPSTLGLAPGTGLEHGVIRLSSGLALQNNGGPWEYLCPAAWGGPGAPPMVLGKAGLWILGDTRTQAWSDGWSNSSEVSGRSALDLASVRGEAWALVPSGDSSSALISFDSGHVLDIKGRWSTVTAHHEGFALGRFDEQSVEVLWVDEQGQPLRQQARQVSSSPVGLDLRTLGRIHYVALTTATSYRVIEVESFIEGTVEYDMSESTLQASTESFTSPKPIQGPILWQDRLMVVSGGAMFEWDDGTISTWWPQRRWTCLHTNSACTVLGMFELQDMDAREPTPFFEISALQGPRQDNVPAEHWPSCQAEWIDYATHAGIELKPSSETSDGVEEHHDKSDNQVISGCMLAPLGPPSLPLPLCVCGILLMYGKRVQRDV